MRREEFDDNIRKMVEGNDSEKRIDELEKRVVDLERRLAEVILVILRMCPGGVGCPYTDRSGTMIPDTWDVIGPYYMPYRITRVE